MMANGKAFKCYATPEALQARREAGEAKRAEAKADGLSEADREALLAEANALLAPYRSPWRDGGDPPAPDAPFTVRLRAPDDDEIAVSDHVQGDVTLKTREIDDLILLRADGTPTYMLAVVVDDHDMGVTHIVRGDDHLTNAARQSLIYKALGWDVPVMAHIPLIHGPDGAKLSKRHGALGAEAYRAMGFLPAAMRNYLARLGWSHGDDEIFSTDDMISWFDLDAIGRSPSRFDMTKLENLNGHYMRDADVDALMADLSAYLPHAENAAPVIDWLASPENEARFRAALPGLKERAKTLVELVDSAGYLWASRPLTLDAKAEKQLDETARAMLGEVADRFDALEAFTAETTEACVRAFAEEKELKLGKVAQPLRAALTGRTTSPPVFDVLEVLGREESLARIRDQAAG